MPRCATTLAARFVATGGSQCGFCTPGILVRLAARRGEGQDPARRSRPRASPRTCAGAPAGRRSTRRSKRRTRRGASRHATRRRRARGRSSRAACRSSSGRSCPSATAASPTTARLATRSSRCRSRPARRRPVEAVRLSWVVAESLLEARALAGKVQGRRTTVDPRPPLALPAPVPAACGSRRRGSSPRTSSPTRRGARRAASRRRRSPTAARSAARPRRRRPARPRELADRTGRTVRVVYSREDVVRLGPKRPPIAALAWLRRRAC